jgi:hypothetical protein
MKPNLFFFILVFCGSFIAKAQTPEAIETDLLKVFKKISASSESSVDYNAQFANKLKKYAVQNPETINQKFSKLIANGLLISKATDGNLRIYSWDTNGGGTMHFFESVFQYKVGEKTYAIIDKPMTDGDNRPNYTNIYTFNVNGETYYLCSFIEIGSTKDWSGGVQCFTIKDGKLNTNAKIIKTKSGLKSEIHYGYDFRSVVDWKVRPIILFDDKTNTLQIPLVDGNYKMTHKFITYQFTGQYFERVRN